jgi:GNAT superfamily N-acetyltransferase
MGELKVESLTARAADDSPLMDELARLINAAYAVGERALWVDGAQRTTPDHVAKVVRDGALLVAGLAGRVVGCARLEQIDETTAELGMVSAAPNQWGSGVGRELLRAGEERARADGTITMQLRVLVPVEGVNPDKEWLRGWYERLGYRLVGSVAFEAAGLTVPCKLLVFHKPLR